MNRIAPGSAIRTGSHGPYFWLTSEEQYTGTLVRLCPEVFVERYLAVTCIDSGDPWLTGKQATAGWQRRSGIVYSPLLTTTDELFFQRDGLDTPGYDEWYVFDSNPTDLGELIRRNENPFEQAHAPRPGRMCSFVNFADFMLHDRSEPAQFLVDMFWKQLEWVKPESYVADGRDCLTFVSRNEALLELVHQRLHTAIPATIAKSD